MTFPGPADGFCILVTGVIFIYLRVGSGCFFKGKKVFVCAKITPEGRKGGKNTGEELRIAPNHSILRGLRCGTRQVGRKKDRTTFLDSRPVCCLEEGRDFFGVRPARRRAGSVSGGPVFLGPSRVCFSLSRFEEGIEEIPCSNCY